MKTQASKSVWSGDLGEPGRITTAQNTSLLELVGLLHEGPRWRWGFNDMVPEKICVLNMEMQLRGLVLFCFVFVVRAPRTPVSCR